MMMQRGLLEHRSDRASLGCHMQMWLIIMRIFKEKQVAVEDRVSVNESMNALTGHMITRCVVHIIDHMDVRRLENVKATPPEL